MENAFSETPFRKTPIRTAEILCVGTELLLGDIINTNAAFLSRRLAAMGISVYHQAVIGDHPQRLTDALSDAFEGHGRPKADLVILSGGLGPTYDDLTKETVAAYFGRRMVLHEPSLERIRSYFARTGRDMSPNNEKQAMMPEGAHVFPNDYGTAPALAVGDDTRTAVLLPGPPAELEPLFDGQVEAFLRPFTDGVLISRNLHIIGWSEASVEHLLHDLMVSSTNPTLAPYCQAGEIRLRITAKAGNVEEARALCDGMIEQVRLSAVGEAIYGVDVGNIETALVQKLTEKGLTISCAESCTGGMIGERLTSVPGASCVFAGGAITYTNEMKMRLLGVRASTLEVYTAVSSQVACEMAEGARRAFGTDLAVSATGYAGPDGGTEENPVGTVYLGIASPNGTKTVRLTYGNSRSRSYIRKASSGRALREALAVVMEGASCWQVGNDPTCSHS